MTRIPLVVSKRQTIGELVELGAFRDFDRIEYDCRRKCFFGIIEHPADARIPVQYDSSFNSIIHALEGLERTVKA